MPSFSSLSEPGAVEALTARLNAITEQSPRKWGRMTANQMFCHLSDAFLAVRGDRPVAKNVDNVLTRTIVKYVALKTRMPWPKGAPTMPECDAEKKGTPPAVFAHDRARAVEVLRQFAAPASTTMRHPLFGPMTHDEWMIWAYRHTDHHLRQFGG